MSQKRYETLEVVKPSEHIWHVRLNRPKKLNAMNSQFFADIKQCFEDANKDEEVRAVVLTGNGKHFSAGLDLMEYGPTFNLENYGGKSCFLAILDCRVPVLVGVHNTAVGGAVDLMSYCDIRYATEDSQTSRQLRKMTIKEVDIGMAADLGTLQLMPHALGNQSFFREAAYTGRIFSAEEAMKYGFVSKIFKNEQEMHNGLLETAKTIAEKSPVAIWTLKQVNNHEMRRRIGDGLDYMARTNSAMLLTGDMMLAVQANLSKSKTTFPKL